MNPHLLLVVLALSAGVFAQGQLKAQDNIKLVTLDDFPTSVSKQLAEAGVLDAFRTAESISVQLISSPLNKNATVGGRIALDIIHPESKRIEPTPKQRDLLSAVFSEDTTYLESLAACQCFFTPQLRVTFQSGEPRKHYNILLSGVSHGEIQVIEDERMVAYARTWRFIPPYLAFMDQVFPHHNITEMLHRFHDQSLRKSSRPES